jgi:hypothetical protein
MSMPSPPAQHSTGDPGHSGDHNTLATITADLQAAATALQGHVQNIFRTTGANACTLPGTGTGLAAITVTAVDRDGGTDLLDFYYGSQLIFSLNSYAELRLAPAQLTHVALIISVLAGQSSAAWQVVSPSQAVLAQVGPDGSAGFSGPVSLLQAGSPVAWQHPSLQNGWTTYQSRTLACKLTNDNMAQLSGQLVPGQVGNGTIVAFMPGGFAPRYRPEALPVSTYNISEGFFGPPDAGMYFEVDTSGRMSVYSFASGEAGSGDHVVISGRYPLDAS